MPDYSMNQIKQMEQDATRRLREMNKLSKPLPPNENHLEQRKSNEPNHNRFSDNRNGQQHNQNHKKEECKPKEEIKQHNKKGAFSFLNALDLKKLIGENSEQAMLLLLILILSNDNTCDEYLIYALVYIML